MMNIAVVTIFAANPTKFGNFGTSGLALASSSFFSSSSPASGNTDTTTTISSSTRTCRTQQYIHMVPLMLLYPIPVNLATQRKANRLNTTTSRSPTNSLPQTLTNTSNNNSTTTTSSNNNNIHNTSSSTTTISSSNNNTNNNSISNIITYSILKQMIISRDELLPLAPATTTPATLSSSPAHNQTHTQTLTPTHPERPFYLSFTH